MTVSISQHFAGQRQTGWWESMRAVFFPFCITRIWKLEECRHQHLLWSLIEIRRSRNLPKKNIIWLISSLTIWMRLQSIFRKKKMQIEWLRTVWSVCAKWRRMMWKRKRFALQNSMIWPLCRGKQTECLVIPHSRHWMPCRRCMSRSLLLIREQTASIWQMRWEKAQKLWFRCYLGKCPMPKGWNISRTWVRY